MLPTIPFSRAHRSLTEPGRNSALLTLWLPRITSLRLIQPRIDIQAAAQAALSFEHKAFVKANEKVRPVASISLPPFPSPLPSNLHSNFGMIFFFLQSDYDRECNEKLTHIRDTRQRQAAVALNMMPQAGGMPNQMQGAFPQQMNRAMQSSPIPGQPQMAMGMGDPNQQVAMQQRQQQQSAMMQQQQQQRAQQRPTNPGTLPDDLSTLSPQELEHVSRLAQQMLTKTSPEDMEKIKMNLSNMSPEQRQYLARKNMDPMTYFFRSQALTSLRRHRRSRMEMGRVNTPMDPNGAMMGDPALNQRQIYQNMMNLQRNSGFSGNLGQGIDSNSFIGNVENIQGQQADGLRSQEAGQLVVPASSSQMNQQPFPNQPNMFPQQMGQNGQNMNGQGMNPQLFNQQNFQNSSNGPQGNMQFQTQQSQAQVHAQAQARAQAAAAQKASLALSGQANAQSQGLMNQTSPQMPMLNQPMAPGQMSPAQVANQNRASSIPNMGQNPAGVQGQPNMQGRPQIPPNLPPAVQEQLAQMSNEQLHAFFMNQRRAAIQNGMARNGSQQPGSIQQPGARPGQGQAGFNAQMGNNPAMRNAMNMPQGINPNASNQQQQMTPQQRAQQQRQQELYKLQLLRQNNGLEMTADQVKEMDRAAFPPSIINHNQNPAQVPKHIKTWGQLKQWVAANPQASNGVDLSKLMTLQKLHFGQIVASRAADPNRQGMPQPMAGPQGQMANNPNFPNGQQQMAGMPPLRPITANDVRMARQKIGQGANNFNDDQIREILQNRQKQILMQATRNRQAAAGMQPGGQQNQPMPPQPPVAPQNVPQAKPPAAQQPPAAAEQQPPAAKAQTNGGAAKNAKAANKQASKNNKVKMEDTAEPRASATPQHPQPAAAPTATPPTARQGLPLTQEQLAALTPQQRMQVEDRMRKQQQQFLRGPILSRAAAEENWNKNIPPQIKEVLNEITTAAPPSKTLPIPPESKAKMAQLLMDSLDILSRLDVLVVHGFGKMAGQERNVRNLLAMRVQIMRQFKNTQEWVPNDDFSITQDYLTGAILFIRKLFQLMIIRFNQQRSNPAQPPAPAAQPTQATANALNASNLRELQQQTEEALHARRASSQSAPVAPAPFGEPSPQGVPHAYGPGGLAPEKLKLPPPKKRKASHAGTVNASPVQPPAVPAAQSVANAPAPVAPLVGAFKCSVAECEHHFSGFPTQAALDKHVEEMHLPEEEEEVIGDPMQYFMDSLDIGLGLVPDPKQPTKPEVVNASTKPNAMASPAKQSIPTPVTAGNTPMARVTSQMGAKTASPATSTQQLTPHQPSNKNVKPSPGKQAGKRTLDDVEKEDMWANAPMNLEKIHDTFAPIFAECRRSQWGYDPFDEFMNTDMFSQDQSDNTPDSRDLALATLTPKDDEHPKIINNQDTSWCDWMPDDAVIDDNSDWLAMDKASTDGLPTGLFAMDRAGNVQLDWDAIDQQQKDLNIETGAIPIAAL